MLLLFCGNEGPPAIPRPAAQRTKRSSSTSRMGCPNHIAFCAVHVRAQLSLRWTAVLESHANFWALPFQSRRLASNHLSGSCRGLKRAWSRGLTGSFLAPAQASLGVNVAQEATLVAFWSLIGSFTAPMSWMVSSTTSGSSAGPAPAVPRWPKASRLKSRVERAGASRSPQGS